MERLQFTEIDTVASRQWYEFVKEKMAVAFDDSESGSARFSVLPMRASRAQELLTEIFDATYPLPEPVAEYES